jgi:hypothetical protein
MSQRCHKERGTTAALVEEDFKTAKEGPVVNQRHYDHDR